ncbi:ABC transporter substrate-binding protein [Mycobacterium sp. 852013-50091_SCH5140682]|uniref:glutamate ABC transporter substrate-binding protein n=1 Tax=Mycobacterium sp. 852013-50091_SCH5140682 TaxID=1834109 RepID=UPI0007EC0ED8|nr:glutamate ABC transporter substrate-binding protein [Mycobacterium sp. 852013-50091_SCH5140682]OBC00539.1 ABC transporter substrate-binding protein [Mycobacterium sp. 852013-50091_SCH5140682]
MRAGTGLLVLAATVLTGCATVQPLVQVPASLTTMPLPSGAEVAPTVTGAAVESCDATASLRPSAAPAPTVDAIRRRGWVVVGIDQNTNPLSFRDPVTGELRGFLVDLSHEVARDLVGDPDKVDFRLLTEPERMPAVQNNTVDILTKATTITCPRAELIAFSTVYFEGHQRLLVPRGSPVRGPADLAGKRVCSALATTSIATVARVAPAATIVGVQNFDDCLVALQQGQVDAASTDDSLLVGMAGQDPNLEIVGPALENEPYGIGVNKSEEDLVRAVNASLDRIRRDGTWEALYRKWFSMLGPATPPEPKYRD